MNKLAFASVAAAALLLSACSTIRPTTSYVAPEIKESDAQVISFDTTNYLADTLPPAKTTLVLEPQPGSGDRLTPVLKEHLMKRGFGVVEVFPKSTVGEGTRLRYLATPLDGGVALRLQFNQTEATRFYPRTASGELSIGAPFTVREGK
ncbi:conjugal transfer protein TrbH [Acinetobacter baumannii]|uniref:conjugal transfer protein TrbH n=1 Tax=Acinetobacter baumannii TaxID=470 RepID=UPI0034E23D95